MNQSKLVQAIKALNKSERNKLLKFVESPYHNQNKEVKLLIEHTIGHLHMPELLAKEHIAKIIYDNQKADFNNLRKKAHEALTLISEFLAITDLKANKSKLQVLTLNAISNRSLNNIYQNLSSKFEQSMQSSDRQVSYYDIYSFEINRFKTEHYDLKRYKPTNIESIIIYLDKFYMIEKIKYACDILSRGGEVRNNIFLDKILEYALNDSSENNYPIKIYYYIYKTLIEFEKEDYYFELKNLVAIHSSKFDFNESRKMYESLVNYSIEKINRGNIYYLSELLDTYKLFLKNEIDTSDNTLDPYNYKNIATTGLRLKEYDWVEYFIETYKDRLSLEYRQNAYTYHLAQLYFYKKEYSNVLKLLQEVEYDDYSYNLGAKSMLIAIYYETEEYDALNSILDSFRVFLGRKRNQLGQAYYHACMNLIKFTRKLLTITPKDAKAIDSILKQMDEAKGIASENWLREKLEDLR